MPQLCRGFWGCGICPLLHLTPHLTHLAGQELDGFGAHGLGKGWEEKAPSSGEGVLGEGVGNAGGGLSGSGDEGALSPLFAQVVDGNCGEKTKQDAQVLQVASPRCSLGTWG